MSDRLHHRIELELEQMIGSASGLVDELERDAPSLVGRHLLATRNHLQRAARSAELAYMAARREALREVPLP